MRRLGFTEAVDDALGQAMAEDPTVLLYGEDVPLLRRELLTRFGPDRVMGAPISESAFVGAAVAAAMGGLRPVVELYMVDFVAVAMDALLNHAAKLDGFTGGRWQAPLVLRLPCGGGYGDGGQHAQALWGWLAHIPGLEVVVPSDPASAGEAMYAAVHRPGPVLVFEHKLLSDSWLEFLGSGGRKTVTFDVPEDGARAQVPNRWSAKALPETSVRRDGDDLTIVSVAVGVHRALEAANRLEQDGLSVAVVDLQSIAPLSVGPLEKLVSRTNRVLVVDEDFEAFGLSGEIAARLLERGLTPAFGRVATKVTIPYARDRERDVLPNVGAICAAARSLLERRGDGALERPAGR